MRILVISPEAGAWHRPTPLSQSVDALASSFCDMGQDVRVYSPYYPSRLGPIPSDVISVRAVDSVQGESFETARLPDSIHRHIVHPGFFDRHGIYNDDNNNPFGDNHRRFSLLASAALGECRREGWVPDRIHAHEWGAAFAMAYSRRQFADIAGKAEHHFTIHNVSYDYHMFEHDIEAVGLDRADFGIDGFEFWGKVSLLKAGIHYADKVVFTSQAYCDNVLNADLPGGLQGFLEYQTGKVEGIQNGIDYSFWKGPAEERHSRKAALQKELGLPTADSFLLYVHLDSESGQSGQSLSTILSNIFTLDIQILVGGLRDRGDLEYYHRIAAQNPARLAVVELDGSNQQLRGLLHAADSVFFCNPEEPSLSILLKTMAAGAVPIASSDRGFGGILVGVDSTADGKGNSFLSETWPDQMLRSVRSATETYQQSPLIWQNIQAACLGARYDWETTACSYLAL